MSLLDVHKNRAPIAGTVVFNHHIPGPFLSLKQDGGIIKNERNSMVIDNGRFRVGIIQIASRLVRQIVTYKRPGEPVGIGERIGMIRFGSQTDLIVPDFVTLSVIEGDQVYAGKTVLAIHPPEDGP